MMYFTKPRGYNIIPTADLLRRVRKDAYIIVTMRFERDRFGLPYSKTSCPLLQALRIALNTVNWQSLKRRTIVC